MLIRQLTDQHLNETLNQVQGDGLLARLGQSLSNISLVFTIFVVLFRICLVIFGSC